MKGLILLLLPVMVYGQTATTDDKANSVRTFIGQGDTLYLLSHDERTVKKFALTSTTGTPFDTTSMHNQFTAWSVIIAGKPNTKDLRQGAYFIDTTAVRSPRTAAGAEGSLWISNAINCTATTTQAATANKLRASPFIPFTDIVIDSARFEISTAAAGGIVWGVYANKNESSIYPGSLVFSKYDTTSAAVKNAGANGTGYQAWSGNKTLKGGTLYWVAYNGNNTATFRAIPQGAVPGVLGYSSSLAANVQVTTLTVDRNMDWTLPGTFPANATALANVAPPIVVMRRDQ